MSFEWRVDVQRFCFVLVQRIRWRPQLIYVSGDTGHHFEHHGPTYDMKADHHWLKTEIGGDAIMHFYRVMLQPS